MKRSVLGTALVAVVSALSAIGCATADKPGHCAGACDLGVGTGGNGEGDMADVPLPMPDLASGALLGFGDTCDSNSQCKSGICIETGTGGICTDLCPDNMCPAGFGCLGVTGAIDPGVVTFVCVPNSSELCTPCQQNGECSVGGHDWCLPTPVGGHFCARDCSKIACPNGFTCQDVTSGDMGTSKQCVPTSGSCDCDASKAGMTVPCTITTPTGTCDGTRTCNGASGWSMTCAPPSGSDSPDDNYKDDNCDGIDGDVSKGIFVAKAAATAVDDGTCGTMAKPCKSINWGISQAANSAMRFVYVQAAVYNEEVVLFNGIDVVGGYDSNWLRAARGTAGHDVVITGGFDSSEGQFISVLAHNIAATTTLWDLDVYGPNANDGLHPGYSSYAVHAYKANLKLHRVGVFGGNGGDGKSGSNGTNAGSLTAAGSMSGAVAPPSPPGPGNADEHATTCDNSGRGRGGDAGGNSCPDDDNPNGGPGGAGGTMDSSCTCVLGVCGCAGSACNATGGLNGTPAATAPAGYGGGGPGGAGGDGTSQGGGSAGAGRVLNGGGGASDARRAGYLVNNYWLAFGGGTGALGKNGSGGGGGGGSGGDDSGIDSWGAGGGGGAAGGCRARAPGTGGQGGGGSFGVFAVQSTITTEMCAFQIGNGGAGGMGGRGGTGQNGGAGAPGGLASGDSKAGGPGGNGGHGGHSGGGGGGNGGIAYGIFSLTSTVNDSSTYTGGSAGAKGSGGLAAAPAPGGANDGNGGSDGYAGLSNGIGTCAAAGGC